MFYLNFVRNGVESWPDRSNFKGLYVYGKKEGKGKLEFLYLKEVSKITVNG